MISRLKASSIIFLQCDMQTIFRDPKLIYGFEGVLQSCMFMAELAAIFKIPILVSEHNPKVFGATLPELKSLSPLTTMTYEKSSFSMLNEEGNKLLNNFDCKTAIIYGIESHICIQQTCLDLVDAGYDVHLISDATSSSKALYRSTALSKLTQYGVKLNTTQGVMFELLGDHKVSEFKEAIKLVKKYPGEHMISHL